MAGWTWQVHLLVLGHFTASTLTQDAVRHGGGGIGDELGLWQSLPWGVFLLREPEVVPAHDAALRAAQIVDDEGEGVEPLTLHIGHFQR